MEKTIMDVWRRREFLRVIRALQTPGPYTWEEIGELREALDEAIRKRIEIDTRKMEVLTWK